MTIGEAIARRIDGYCKERNITLNKLCTMSGVIQSTVHDVFSGRSKAPRTDTIYNLCIGLRISISEFFDSPLFDEENIQTD